ncbi:peptidoglycan DD-metalloendopeptidase family protein [Alkalinema pantanalense CENA528]|uniref:M23 family metallopeptidase n=1 Tax=Alkalinema pantanalense TaxID=1620705 RepID=UPI003D6ED338
MTSKPQIQLHQFLRSGKVRYRRSIWLSLSGLLSLVAFAPIALAQTAAQESAGEFASPAPAVTEPAGDSLGGAGSPEAVPVAPIDAPSQTHEPDYSAGQVEPPQQVESADVFIDRTDYSLGATQREVPAADGKPAPSGSAIAVGSSPSAAPVRVGSLNFSASGPSWTPATVNPNAIASAPSYFSKKLIRPFGRMGNGNLKLMFPLAIPAPITSLFGWRIHPITGEQRMHTGTDIGAPMGTPVLAALAGRVLLADFLGGYGLTIALEHTDGTQQTLYAHLSEIFVKPGELIQQGAAIGRVGSTGNSTGPHLHFELRQLTDEGWVAMDAGLQLETAMADLVKSLQVAKNPATPQATQPRS